MFLLSFLTPQASRYWKQIVEFVFACLELAVILYMIPFTQISEQNPDH